jgi:hypothetical protein
VSTLWTLEIKSAAERVGEWALNTARLKKKCSVDAECVILDVSRDDILKTPRAVLAAVESVLKLSVGRRNARVLQQPPSSENPLTDAEPAPDDLKLITGIFGQYVQRAHQESVGEYLPPLFDMY